MTVAEIKKIKDFQMEIMDEVHKVCVENGLVYYIIGGTALGAVRHGGFIPWDVDIDIAMPRRDYEQFEKFSATKLDGRYFLKNYKNTPKYSYPHARVGIKNTQLYDKLQDINPKEEILPIYIDIFPLDNAPTDETLQQKQSKDINRIRKQKYIKHARCYRKDFKNLYIKKILSLLLFWTDMNKLNAEFDAVCRRYEDVDTGLLCSMASHYKYSKQCMPASVYGKPQLIKFENREYYAPEKLDDYLTRIYGDYMKLPPEEERQSNLKLFTKVVFDK